MQARVARVGRAVQAFQRSTDAFDDAVAARLGLNRRDLRGLDWLASDGPMAATELATAIGLSSAATTALLDRLEAKGLVRRERDTADRRRVLVSLTAHAGAVIGELYGPLAAAGAVQLSRYDAEQLALLEELLARSTAILDARRAALD